MQNRKTLRYKVLYRIMSVYITRWRKNINVQAWWLNSVFLMFYYKVICKWQYLNEHQLTAGSGKQSCHPEATQFSEVRHALSSPYIHLSLLTTDCKFLLTCTKIILQGSRYYYIYYSPLQTSYTLFLSFMHHQPLRRLFWLFAAVQPTFPYIPKITFSTTFPTRSALSALLHPL